MIRFWCRTAAALVVMYALLICGVSLLGRSRTDPLMPLFTNPDGTRCEMPCLFGIQPGITTLSEAVILVQNHVLTHNMMVFLGDFTGAPTSRYGSSFYYEETSVLFMGQQGQAVALQIYHIPIGDYSITDYSRVNAVCLRSVPSNASVVLPQITSELARMWHKSSFYQMIISLGAPQSISTPLVLPTRAWGGFTRMESFYFDDRLVITHSNDQLSPPAFNRNFFGSVCVYAVGNPNYRFITGYHGRVGAAVPWLGVPIRNYEQWTAANPPVIPWIMP